MRDSQLKQQIVIKLIIFFSYIVSLTFKQLLQAKHMQPNFPSFNQTNFLYNVFVVVLPSLFHSLPIDDVEVLQPSGAQIHQLKLLKRLLVLLQVDEFLLVDRFVKRSVELHQQHEVNLEPSYHVALQQFLQILARLVVIHGNVLADKTDE